MGILSDRIYKGLVEIQRQEEIIYQTQRAKSKRPKSLTASTISPVACRRSNWYSLKKLVSEEVQEPDAGLLSIFRDGRDAHEWLGNLLTEVGVKILDSEFGLECQGIYARVDRKIKMDNKVYNLEFKTGNSGTYATYCKFGLIAFPGYYAQSQVIIGGQPSVPLIFMMKCKDSGAYEDEIVQEDKLYISNLVKIKGEFDQAMFDNVPPERDFGYGSPECQGCENKFKCWFSHLRADTLMERDLSIQEGQVINELHNKLRDIGKVYEDYVKTDQTLRDFIAYLHTKHAVSKIKLEGITSSFVQFGREYPDLDYIRSVLTDKELVEAFVVRQNKFFRTLIK